MSNTPLPPVNMVITGYDEHMDGNWWHEASMHAHAAAVSAERDARIKVLEDALTKIDAIRNDIIGRQNIGWSAHVYPLVAALGEAGYPGMDYKAARAALGDKNG